jgi:uncharacterized protein
MIEYLTPLVGGLLIGTAALAMMHFLGRIAGIGGITWAAVSRQADSGWRWLFLLGLLGGAFLYHFASAVPFPAPSDLSWAHTIGAGLLVGFGSRLGSGCTSGHGVCGIGRLSKRSLISTIVFLGTGVVTVFVIRHVI